LQQLIDFLNDSTVYYPLTLPWTNIWQFWLFKSKWL